MKKKKDEIPVLEKIRELLARVGNVEVKDEVDLEGVDIEEIYALLKEAYGSSKPRSMSDPLVDRFEIVLKSFVEDEETLKKQIKFHEERLERTRSRYQEVCSVLGVLSWLNDNVFIDAEGHWGAPVREALTTFSTYQTLMRKLKHLIGEDPPKRPPKPHRTTTPLDEIPFWCVECGLGFRDEDDYNRHTDTKCEYQGDEGFQAKREAREKDAELYCSECGFRAKTVGGKKTHMRGHANRKEKAKKASRLRKTVKKKARK